MQLLQGFRTATSPHLRRCMVRYVSNMAEHLSETELRTWYGEERGQSVRGAVGRALIGSEDAVAVATFDSLYAGEQDESVRTRLMDSLGLAKTKESVERLTQLSITGDVGQRSRALGVLFRRHKPFMKNEKIALMLKATKDPTPEIRIAGLRGIYSLSSKDLHGDVFRWHVQFDESKAVRDAARLYGPPDVKELTLPQDQPKPLLPGEAEALLKLFEGALRD